jgi:DNA repair protein SbcD/Mre11
LTKLLCTGDIHLGAGAEYGRRPGDRLRDQQDVLERIADLAIEEAVDGILLAGDTFNGPAAPPEQLAVLAHFIDRLQGRIPILAISGNGVHDLAMRSTNAVEIFNHFDGIQVYSQPDVVPFAGCAVATLPWVSPARLVAARNGGDRDEIHADVAQLLLEIAARSLEDCRRVVPGAPTILLGHWSVSGAALPNGLPVDQLREPVIPIADLDALGFDHVVFGHIHKQQRLGGRGFYVGSPMPLNFGEAGHPEEHGVVIVHTDEREDVDFYAAEVRPIASRRLVTIDWASQDFEHLPPLAIESAADGAIVRLRYTATAEQQRSIDTADLRRQLLVAGAAVVKVVPDIVREERARVDGVDEQLDIEAALDLWLAANEIPEGVAERMRARTVDYLAAEAIA